jgi:ParB-like chromosome segregation protein Spo0J
MSRSRNDFVANLPVGSKHLSGNLYLLPFASIRTPDRNPRLLTEKGQADLVDKTLSSQLRESIKKNTLLNPLVCRWVKEGDNLVPMVIGGDRRHRALHYLVSKKEMVSDPRVSRVGEDGQMTNHQAPAHEAYEFVTCQVFMCSDDLQALALSWAENKNRVNLTDGHEIAELIQLRDNGATDAQIMEILQQDQKWLAETDRLIASLDSMTLADLMENRIDRNGAIELAAIGDVKVREKVRNEAHRLAIGSWAKKIEKLHKKIAESEDVEEEEMGNVVFSDSDDDRTRAQQQLERIRSQTNALRRQVSDTTPTTTSNQIRESSRTITGQTPRNPSRRGPKGGPRKMRQSEIEKGLEIFQGIVRANGRVEEESFTPQMDALKLLVQIFRENIIPNNPDWIGTLRRFYS